VYIPSNKKAQQFVNVQKEEDKNPFALSYCKNAMKRTATASMQNLHNTVTTFPQYSQVTSLGNSLPRDGSNKKVRSPGKFSLNLKASLFLNFIVTQN
jgi:hypothetical protein